MSHDRGFTLIEMLVALAIFAMLISVLMLGYQQGLLMWQKSYHSGREFQRLGFRHQLLDRLFAESLAAYYHAQTGTSVPFFVGDGREMQWMSAAPLMDVPGHVRPVALRAVRDRQEWRLEYREGSRYSDPDRGLSWSEAWVPVLDGLKQIAFAYEAPANPLPPGMDPRELTAAERLRYRDQPEWLTTFDSRVLWSMPYRVRLRFTDAAGRQREWLFILPETSSAWPLVSDGG